MGYPIRPSRCTTMRPAHILLASLVAAALAVSFVSPSSAHILITIDKTTQRMAVAVDGTQRYVWPISTGRAGYDTPNGTFKPNRMDADHMSQEWDNAPMPHSIFFDMDGHAIHGFFDVKHLGLPVSHGCVRLSPDNAAVLYNLVQTEGMSDTTVVVSGRTPSAGTLMARRPTPEEDAGDSAPMQIAPPYAQQPPAYYGQQQTYDGQAQRYYAPQGYGQSYYGQYGQPYQQPQYYRQFTPY